MSHNISLIIKGLYTPDVFFFSWCAPLIRHEYFYTECKHHAAKSNPAIFHIENKSINQWNSLCGMVKNNSHQSSVVARSIQFSSVATQLTFVGGKNKTMKETILDSKSHEGQSDFQWHSRITHWWTQKKQSRISWSNTANSLLKPSTTSHFNMFIIWDKTHTNSNSNATRPWPFIVKLVQQQCRQLKGTDYGIHKKSSADTNSSFPSANTR